MLVLSLFAGVGLLDRAFEESGFCVVRGPDLLWGQDIRNFHPPSGVWDGCIGGPPCQMFSQLRHLNPKAGQRHGNLIPEFDRVVEEAQPLWFLMENVSPAPIPQPRGYWAARTLLLNNRWLGAVQNRLRRFSFGIRFDVAPHGIDLDVSPDLALFENPIYEPAALAAGSGRRTPVKLGGSGKVKRTYTADGKRNGPSAGRRLTVQEMLELQGVDPDWLSECPFTQDAKRHMIGNGVPLPLGRAVARAVRRALIAATGEETR